MLDLTLNSTVTALVVWLAAMACCAVGLGLWFFAGDWEDEDGAKALEELNPETLDKLLKD